MTTSTRPRRNRNHMKFATVTVPDGTETTTNGTVKSWQHRNTQGGFARVVDEMKAWAGFTAADGHVTMKAFTQDETPDVFGQTVTRWVFHSSRTGRSVPVTVRSGFVTD